MFGNELLRVKQPILCRDEEEWFNELPDDLVIVSASAVRSNNESETSPSQLRQLGELAAGIIAFAAISAIIKK